MLRPGRAEGAGGLAASGLALMVNVVASGITGLGFWLVAARVASPASVAEASTAISAIIAVVSLAQQSFVLTLPSLLAASARPRRLTLTLYRAALAMTALVAPVYVVVGPAVAGGLEFLRGWPMAASFVAASLVWCVFSLQDAVLIGLRKAHLVLVENTSWGASRLVILALAWAAGGRLGMGALFASWMVPAVLCVAVITRYLFAGPSTPLDEAFGTQELERRRFVSYMGAEYATSVLGSVITLVTGAYALTVIGAEAAAPLVIAASLVIVVEQALSAFAQALAVEASRPSGSDEHRAGLLRLSAAVLGVLSFGSIAAAWLGGGLVMSMFGGDYREASGNVLGILMLAMPARALSFVANADNRIRGEGGRNLVQQVVAVAVCFALLATGRFDTAPRIAAVMVLMRYAGAVVAAAHLRRGRLQLAAP